MRVTEKIISNGLSRNINNTMRRMDKSYDQLSTGKRINYPSDDPVGLITSLRLRDTINQTNRYTDNSQTAISWLEASDSALNEMTNVLHRLEELGVAAANGQLTGSSRKALADEVHQLKEHVGQIANTQHENRFLFAGQCSNEPAYDTTTFAYQGDNRRLNMEIGAASTLEVSYNGPEVFGDFFNQLDEFEANIRDGNTGKISSSDLTVITEQLDKVLDTRAAIGAKVNRLEKNIDRYNSLAIQYNKLMSENEDTDIAEATTQLKMQESVYQAALAVGARILQTTLVDYLK